MNNPDEPQIVGISLPTGTDVQSISQRVEAMEMLLERSFKVPGTNFPIGLDSIIGLIPVLGDIVTTALGAYIVWAARNLRIIKKHLDKHHPEARIIEG